MTPLHEVRWRNGYWKLFDSETWRDVDIFRSERDAKAALVKRP